MSQNISFSFTLLDEKDDGYEVANTCNSHLDLELQPHLYTYSNDKYIDVAGSQVTGSGARLEQSVQKSLASSVESNSASEIMKVRAGVELRTSTHSAHMLHHSLKHSELEDAVNSSQTNEVPSPAQKQSKIQIQYIATGGKINVMEGEVRTMLDGSRYIDTQGISETWSKSEEPLPQRKIKMLKMLSILACIAFFPFGLPAVYFAFRTETEFNAGIMRGNIDKAQKFAKRSWGLIVISFIMSLVVVALIVTAIVRSYNENTIPRGPVMG